MSENPAKASDKANEDDSAEAGSSNKQEPNAEESALSPPAENAQTENTELGMPKAPGNDVSPPPEDYVGPPITNELVVTTPPNTNNLGKNTAQAFSASETTLIEVSSSSKERRLEYFRSGTNADCEVHAVSDGGAGSVCYKKFRCHRIFLATASEKLEKDIFQNKQWNGVLLINGVSKESVEIFLEYIYTFEVSPRLVDLKIIGDIFVLACAYNMPELMSQFSEQMKSKDWPLDSIFPAFDLAFRHNIIDLEEACLKKILENAADLKSEATIMKLQIYAFNYVIQHWKSMEIMAQSEIIHLLQAYQKHNDIRFSKADVFPHFSKIINYFPSILLDADGFIHKY